MAVSGDRIRIQLAIQGGGAKIVAIMAVLEAIEELEGALQVVRVVGTSAGAIAGVLYASDVGISKIVNRWRKGELKHLLASLTMPKPLLFWKEAGFAKAMITSKPIWDSKQIHDYLWNAIQKDDGDSINAYSGPR